MTVNFDFHASLLRFEELLSKDDRQRLHLLLGDDVSTHLQDDSPIGDALRVIDSLMEQASISQHDCNSLSEAFNMMHCDNACRRLLGKRGLLLSCSSISRLCDILQRTNELNNTVTHFFCHCKRFWQILAKMACPRSVCIRVRVCHR
jgi:hypothetical protein